MSWKDNADFFILLSAAIAGVGWLTFVAGYGMEANNSARLPERGWDDNVERFNWYLFSILGAVSMLVMMAYAFNKRRSILAVSLGISAVALLTAGAPLDETGNFIWECNREDAVTGETKTGAGCQEETFNNYCLMFSGTVTYSLFQIVCVVLSILAPVDTTFSFTNDSMAKLV